MSCPKYEPFQGDNGMWGVLEDGVTLYEADMARMTAEALADMYNSAEPPVDWEHARETLVSAGLPV